MMVDPLEQKQHASIVVMQVGETRFGLIVDEVFDTEEIVVKPLSKRLGSMSEYSGATILGDRAVIMILDPNGISKSVANVARSVERLLDEQSAAIGAHGAAAAAERTSMLLFNAGGEQPRACPLSLVTRLEELDATRFEPTARGLVVQYRGRLMPLASMGGDIRREGKQPVLVFSQGESVIGLVVDRILDIVEEPLDIQIGNSSSGALGTAVLKGVLTEVIDIGYFLGAADPNWAVAAAQLDSQRVRKRVLLVESHSFFRNLLAPVVTAAGYDVTIARTAEEARARLKSSIAFDVVLADADDAQIAVPSAQKVIPMSSRADTEAVPKSDRHALLSAIASAVRQKDLGEAA